MKAFIFEKYGSPDVLKLEEIDKPIPRDNEILVKVHAVSANPFDWHRMRSDPFIARISDGLRKPKNTLIGADIAGTVAAVGKNVTDFKPGDAVFGDVNAGGFAEYVCASENQITHKPSNLSFEEAAAVPIAALTALQGLRDKGRIQSGSKVLINGSSGGVGTYAVQMAKTFGAEVTAVCSTRNINLVRSLGADYVIDYTQGDFTRNSQQYDLILDNVGNLTVAKYKRLLAPEGSCVIVGFSSVPRLLQVLLLGAWTSKTSGKQIGMMMANVNRDDLNTIAELLELSQVKSVIDKYYPFNELPEAIRYLETGRARGKVVIPFHI